MKKVYLNTFIFGLFVIVIFIVYVIINNNVVFYLNGNSTYIVKVNSKYNDLGFVAKVFNKDLQSLVNITGNVDTTKTGEYLISYNLNFLGKNYYLDRKINVVDNQEPDIILNGDKEINIYIGDEYEELGASAFDNYDGNITNNIVISGTFDNNKIGEYILTYTVSDSSKNVSSVDRKIIVKAREEKIKEGNDYSKNSNCDKISDYILLNGYNVSIGYYNLITGKTYLYDENKIYYGASLIKTLDAIYLYDNNLVTSDLKDYIEAAIERSDNDAHYYLINYIGKNNLKDYGISLGAKYTLYGNDNYGSTNVIDQMIYMKKLFALSKNNDELRNLFINNYGNYMQIDGVINMHKYGYYGKYYHDVGIFFDDEPYVLVILTEHGNNNEKDVINDISNLMYKYHRNVLKLN